MASHQDRGTQRPILFKQEFRNGSQAFQMSGTTATSTALIARAAKPNARHQPLVIGSMAWMGGDRHAMAWRRGRCITKVETASTLTPCPIGRWLKQVIDADSPARGCSSMSRVGSESMIACRMGRAVRPRSSCGELWFGALSKPPPLDERAGRVEDRSIVAQMWMKSKEWLEDAPARIRTPTR